MIPESPEFDVNNEACHQGRSLTIADAQLKLAIACLEQRDLEAAKQHAKIAAKRATPDWPHLEMLGIVLFQLSRFRAARRVLIQASQNEPLGIEALKILAALYHRAGEVENSRHCIAAMVQFNAIAFCRRPSCSSWTHLRRRSPLRWTRPDSTPR